MACEGFTGNMVATTYSLSMIVRECESTGVWKLNDGLHNVGACPSICNSPLREVEKGYVLALESSQRTQVLYNYLF